MIQGKVMTAEKIHTHREDTLQPCLRKSSHGTVGNRNTLLEYDFSSNARQVTQPVLPSQCRPPLQ